MRNRKTALLVRVAVAVAAALLPLAVNPAPAQAASCRTGVPLVGARSNRYNIVTTGIDVRRVHHFTWDVYFVGGGYRVFRDPRQIVWRAPRARVSEVRGWVFFTSSERNARISCGWRVGV